MFKNMKIKGQLILIGAFVLLVPILLIAFFAISRSTEGLTHLSAEELRLRAKELAQTVDLLIDANERMIVETARSHSTVLTAEHVMRNDRNKDYYINELNLELSKVNSDEGIYKYIQTFIVSDANGIVFASNYPDKYTGIDISDRIYFKESLTGKDYIGSIIQNKVTGEYFIPFSAPIKSDGGKIIGVVAGVFDPRFANEYIGKVKAGDTGYAFMADRNTTTLAHPDESLIYNLQFSTLEGMERVTERMVAGEEGVEKYVYNGDPKTCGFAPIKRTGWSVCLTVLDTEFLASANSVRNIIIIIGAIAFVVAMIIFWIFAGGISTKMDFITEGSIRLATGDVELKGMDTHMIEKINQRGDEFGDIGRAFTQLIGYLTNQAQYADKISRGDLDFDIKAYSDEDTLSNSMIRMKKNLKALINDIAVLVKDISHGKFRTRANPEKHQGEYQNIMRGVNSSLDGYLEALESIPSPVMSIDKDFNILYLNKNGKELVGTNNAEGKKCYDLYHNSECNSEKCAVGRAMREKRLIESETDSHPNGKDLEIKYYGVPLEDSSGEIVGGYEIVIDQTASKVLTRYQDSEVIKLSDSLEALSKGDLEIDLVVGSANQYTENAFNNFSMIKRNLDLVVDSVQELISDTNMIVESALVGDLDSRADITKHQGDYKKVIEGVNNILNAIIEPLSEAMDVMSSIASKDLTKHVAGSYQGQFREFGDNINRALANLSEAMNVVSNTTINLNSTADNLSVIANNLASGTRQMSEQSNSVASASEQISSNVDEVTNATEKVANGISNVAAASEEMSTSVDTVAVAIEELTSSLQEVSKNTLRGSQIADNAVTNASEATEVMEELNYAANEIGKVVDVITDIAEQTNLLALNATIEAASAGEAGKGFAVVANEVKELAKQTAQATNEITEQINNMQGKTNQAVESIKSISNVINEIGNITNIIATAVEEQTSTTNEISRSVTGAAQGAQEVSKHVGEMNVRIEEEVLRAIREAAIGVNDIAKNISGINSESHEMSGEAATTNNTSAQIADLARELQNAVGQFKI